MFTKTHNSIAQMTRPDRLQGKGMDHGPVHAGADWAVVQATQYLPTINH